MLQRAERSLQQLQTVARLSHVLSEPVLICEKNREPGKSPPILVFSGNFGDLSRPPCSLFMTVWAKTGAGVSVYRAFCRAPAVLPFLLAKGADSGLAASSAPSMALSTSSGVLTFLLVSPLCS